MVNSINAAHFDNQDEEFMSLALQEARKALDAGDYPVGAVLTLGGKPVAQARNTIFTDSRTSSHAELNLLSTHSARIHQWIREGERPNLCLYTTLEPCLMCTGATVQHRIPRVVYACPDPHGGAHGVNPHDLGCFYAEHWPCIEQGPLKEESLDLILEFLKSGKFLSNERMLQEFSRMKKAGQ